MVNKWHYQCEHYPSIRRHVRVKVSILTFILHSTSAHLDKGPSSVPAQPAIDFGRKSYVRSPSLFLMSAAIADNRSDEDFAMKTSRCESSGLNGIRRN